MHKLSKAFAASLESSRVQRQGEVVKHGGLVEQLQTTGLTLAAVRETLPADATEAPGQSSWSESRIGFSGWGPSTLRPSRSIRPRPNAKIIWINNMATSSPRSKHSAAPSNESIVKRGRASKRRSIRSIRGLGELFTKVFGGGHAYLELTGEDLLDTGVTLMARPPGKRNASIHLLSGGEKAMTAIALIFAIFQLNPSPVCLLDEVDAPLDDSNVVRFASLIREMSADVQFVVITHNKLTMEMADHLMGVTMHEPGVSRLVSVDVEEAAQMAAV